MPGVRETMREYKNRELHSGSKHGPLVKSRKQAIAIALNSERPHSNPDETRGSGQNLNDLGECGGPFQAYGPGPGEENPADAYFQQRREFSMDVPDRIESIRFPPRRQIKDGGNP